MSDVPQEDQVKRQDRPGHVMVDKAMMEFGPAKSLDRFLEGYQFFTPAMPYLFGGFTDEPLAHFMAEFKKPVDFMHHRFTLPIFSGMDAPNGDRAWNYVLWAVEKQIWPALENFLLSVAITDTRQQRVYRLAAQDIHIVDPLWADKSLLHTAFPPTIPIVALGVDSNRGVVALSPPKRPVVDQPHATYFQPSEKTKKFADLLFKMESPVAAVNTLADKPNLPKAPVNLRLQPLSMMTQAEQADYFKHIEEYRKGFA